MSNTKKFFSLLLASTFLSAAIPASAARAADDSETTTNAASKHEERLSFANSFANIVLAVISDGKKSPEKRREVLAEAFSKSVDIDWIAKFVIGRNWNKASETQREKYTELYKDFLTKTYVENFAENPDKKITAIKVLGVSEVNDENFNVTTQIKLSNGDNLNVAYMVREKDKKYKVLDIAIENVSLITTHRAEFTTIAATHGLDGVIGKLSALLGQKGVITLSMN